MESAGAKSQAGAANFGFVVNHFGEQNFGSGEPETASGHLFGIGSSAPVENGFSGSATKVPMPRRRSTIAFSAFERGEGVGAARSLS